MMRSLYGRLIAGMVAGIAVLLLLFGFGVYESIRRALVGEFDAGLAAKARMLAAAVELDKGSVELDFDVQALPEFVRKKKASYFELWLEDGTVASRSPSLGEADLPLFHGPKTGPRFQAVTLPDGKEGRAAGIRFVYARENRGEPRPAGESASMVLVVAAPTDELGDHLRSLRWLLAGAGLGTMLAALAVTTVVVRRGLRPLGALAARIAAIKEDELDARVATAPMPAEMVPVGEKLNDLLERLDAAFSRERSFTADVAHELRTPLAGVRATIEVALSRPREPDQYREALSDALAISVRMGSMVDSLLMLTRLDAGQVEQRRELVDVAALAEHCWGAFAGKARARGLALENGIPPGLSCMSDRNMLSTVLSDVLGNAVDHADENGRVWLSGRTTGEGIELLAANSGCRLTQEEAGHVFDRFWRGDSARADTGVHSGLGLALVQRLIRALGGSVSVTVDDGNVFTLRIVLPGQG